MTFIISAVISFLLAYRYFSLFLITFLAAFIFPLPSNLSVMTAASFTTQGLYNIYFVILVALAGNVAGDLSMYFLARRYGRQTLEKISIFKRLFNSSKYDYYVKKIEVYAPVTIIVSRFVTEVNPLVNIICGVVRMPFSRYFIYELFGEILDVLTFALVGYFLGLQGLSIIQTTLLLLFVVVCMWLIISLIRKYIVYNKGI